MFTIDLDKLLSKLAYSPTEPMLFSSITFLWVFAFFMLAYPFVSHTHRAKLTFVTLFSLYFYYKSSGWYFLLLIASTVIDYSLAHQIHISQQEWKRKSWLILSLFANLGLLVYFKYTNFFFEIGSIVIGQEPKHFDIFLPAGVSFFTFQSISYTIDVYRKHMKPVPHILDYAFFVTFFPQLVAGPIIRAYDFAPQIYKPVHVSKEMFGRGGFLILSGLIKKVVISDYISSNFVDRIFDNPTLYSGFENLIGVYGYALQIYCDFSGYSDMAIGIALWLGFHFSKNFEHPYRSKSITEFWRRWHISLSSWLRDYLYISLGGNRKGKFRTYLNQFITMFLGGLWHGAHLRFLVWGSMHGIALGIDKWFSSKVRLPDHFLIRLFGAFFTFQFVCFCWIFFRAEDMQIALQVILQIFTSFHPEIALQFLLGYPEVIGLMIFGYLLHFLPVSWKENAQKLFTSSHWSVQAIVLTVCFVIVYQFMGSGIKPFIYFQF